MIRWRLAQAISHLNSNRHLFAIAKLQTIQQENLAMRIHGPDLSQYDFSKTLPRVLLEDQALTHGCRVDHSAAVGRSFNSCLWRSSRLASPAEDLLHNSRTNLLEWTDVEERFFDPEDWCQITRGVTLKRKFIRMRSSRDDCRLFVAYFSIFYLFYVFSCCRMVWCGYNSKTAEFCLDPF